ncbi:hypothetical protein PMAYCL1PPCAC_27357, partial [Pristionchus mayeri]
FQTTMRKAGRGKAEEDALRDLRFFFLIAHEYTSNIKGDRVCPAEITLLSFSLNRGMQKLLSGVLTYEHSLVTDKDNLNEREYNTLVDSYEKTGICAEQFIPQSHNPRGSTVIGIPILKSELLRLLANKNTPILLLKSNFNEAAGMLHTLFPEHWDHLEARIFFLDDLFRVYTRLNTGRCESPPLRGNSNIHLVHPCPFHQDLIEKGRNKECTQQIAIYEMQILFKNLSDARVLRMDRFYERSKHELCTQEDWYEFGPQIQWEQGEWERRRKEQGPRDDSSNSDSDLSLDEMPEIDDYDSRSDLTDARNNNVDDGRGGGNQADRYEGGWEYGRREEYGSRENTSNGGSQQGDYYGGFEHSNEMYCGRDGNGRSDEGETRTLHRPPSPTFIAVPEMNARPTPRPRTSLFTQRGHGGVRDDERWMEYQRSAAAREQSPQMQQQARAEPQGNGIFSTLPLFNSSPVSARGEPVNLLRDNNNRMRSDRNSDDMFGMERETCSGGGRQSITTPPSRDGANRREVRPHSALGGSSFFSRGVMPATLINVPIKAKKRVPNEAELKEDQEIQNSVMMLPRGTFDKHTREVSGGRDPWAAPTFRPFSCPPTMVSNEDPMPPLEEWEDMKNLNINGGSKPGFAGWR